MTSPNLPLRNPEPSSRRPGVWALAIGGLMVLGIGAFALFKLRAEIDPHAIADAVRLGRAFAAEHLAAAVAAYALLYCGFAALALPGAWLVSVAGGALFGPWLGTPLVLLANTAGATLAMLVSRYLLRRAVTRRFGALVERVDAGVSRDGANWLLAARLAPALPFALVNVAVGLTRMPAGVFAAVSALGALPMVVVFVQAGATLADIENAGDLMNPRLVAALILVALAALVAGPIARASVKGAKLWRRRRA